MRQEKEKAAHEAKLRREELEAQLKAFKEEQRRKHEQALLELEEAREAREAAAEEAAESEPKEKLKNEEKKVKVIKKKKGEGEGEEKKVKVIKRKKDEGAGKQKEGANEASRKAPEALAAQKPEIFEGSQKYIRKKEEIKKKKEEEEAKKKEREEEASRKASEAVAAWKQERLEAKRKADTGEAEWKKKMAKVDPEGYPFAGGFLLNEKVENVVDLKVEGEVAVLKGTAGTIEGPAEEDPNKKVQVQFGNKVLAVFPREIKRPGGLPGGKEKQVKVEEINRTLKYNRRPAPDFTTWNPDAWGTKHYSHC